MAAHAEEPRPEPVDGQSTPPRLPVWPLYLTGTAALGGPVLYAVRPSEALWYLLPLTLVPFLVVSWRREKRATRLGWTDPRDAGVVDDWGGGAPGSFTPPG